MRALLKPHDIPPWLEDFPYAHAAKSSAIRASAAELRQFNASMEGFDRDVFAPASVIRGSSDETAKWAWHGAWLEQVAPKLSVRCLPGAGHAPHQVEPEVLVDAIEAMVTGQSPVGERAVQAMTSRSLRVAPGYASTRSRMAWLSSVPRSAWPLRSQSGRRTEKEALDNSSRSAAAARSGTRFFAGQAAGPALNGTKGSAPSASRPTQKEGSNRSAFGSEAARWKKGA